MSKYKDLLDCINEVVFVQHPTTGEVLYVNKRFEEVYGYTEEEIYYHGLPLVLVNDGVSRYCLGNG